MITPGNDQDYDPGTIPMLRCVQNRILRDVGLGIVSV